MIWAIIILNTKEIIISSAKCSGPCCLQLNTNTHDCQNIRLYLLFAELQMLILLMFLLVRFTLY